MKFSKQFIYFSALAKLVSADSPAICQDSVISGSWTFTLSGDKQNVNLFNTNQVCGHHHPNKI